MGKLRYLFYKRWLTPIQRYRWKAARRVKRLGIERIRKRIEVLEFVLHPGNDLWFHSQYVRKQVIDWLGWDVAEDDHEWWDLLGFPKDEPNETPSWRTINEVRECNGYVHQ